MTGCKHRSAFKGHLIQFWLAVEGCFDYWYNLSRVTHRITAVLRTAGSLRQLHKAACKTADLEFQLTSVFRLYLNDVYAVQPTIRMAAGNWSQLQDSEWRYFSKSEVIKCCMSPTRTRPSTPCVCVCACVVVSRGGAAIQWLKLVHPVLCGLKNGSYHVPFSRHSRYANSGKYI